MDTMFLVFIIVFIIIIIVCFLRFSRHSSAITTERTPTLGGFPIITGLLEFMRVFGPSAHKVLASRYQEYGPVYQFGILKNKMTFLFRLEDVLKLKEMEGINPVHLDFKHLRLYRQHHGLPLGLLVGTGEDWHRQRKIVGKTLLSSFVLKLYFDSVNKIAENKVDGLANIVYKTKGMKMDDLIGQYVLTAMAKVIMGFEGDHEEEQTVKDFNSIISTARENFKDAKTLLSIPSSLWFFVRAWKRHSCRWDNLLSITKRHIKKYMRSSSQSNESVMKQLLQSSDLSLPEAHINITDLILASIDTTSSTLLWCLYELSRSPEIQQELYLEIHDFIESQGMLTFNGLLGLPFLKAVFKESQRLHPVGFLVSRIIQDDSCIGGYHFSKDSHIAGSMYIIGRDSCLFPSPQLFNPYRWLDENKDMKTFTNNIPFGLGRRMCVGRRVAELVMLTYVFYLVKSYILETVTDDPVEPTFRLLMVPRDPIIIKLKSRNH